VNIRIFHNYIQKLKKKTEKNRQITGRRPACVSGILPNLRKYEKTFKIELKIKKTCDTMN